MGDELLCICDDAETHGLVDYELGFWEEEIMTGKTKSHPMRNREREREREREEMLTKRFFFSSPDTMHRHPRRQRLQLAIQGSQRIAFQIPTVQVICVCLPF